MSCPQGKDHCTNCGFCFKMQNIKINLGHVVKAIRKPLIIVPVNNPHPREEWRSWVDMENPSIVYLGDPDDLAHELGHVLDFSLGTEEAEKVIGVSFEDAFIFKHGYHEDVGYDDEDFAEVMESFFSESISTKQVRTEKNE